MIRQRAQARREIAALSERVHRKGPDKESITAAEKNHFYSTQTIPYILCLSELTQFKAIKKKRNSFLILSNRSVYETTSKERRNKLDYNLKTRNFNFYKRMQMCKRI